MNEEADALEAAEAAIDLDGVESAVTESQ